VAEPRRLRHTLLNTAALIARHSKQSWRRLPDNWPRTPQLLAAYGSPSSRRHPADHPAPTRRAPSASFVLPPTHRPQNPRVDSHDDSTEWRYKDSDLASLGRNGDTLLRRPALVIRLAAAATATRDEGACRCRRPGRQLRGATMFRWTVIVLAVARSACRRIPPSQWLLGRACVATESPTRQRTPPSTPPAACAHSRGARGSSHIPAGRSHGSV
jgi:hypothetical protein